jgi:hypothetical protein
VEQLGPGREGITQKMEEPPGGGRIGLGGSCTRPFSGEETEDESAWTLNRFRQSDSMPR